MSLTDYVGILGRGPGRSRSLTFEEARDTMANMLSGEAAPEAVGAVLMLLRMKGETAEEIAGFASAAQMSLPIMPPADLDWSSYAAGRSRGRPWFLLSARLVADAGYRVLLHGSNGGDTTVRDALPAAGIAVADGYDSLANALDRDRICYAPLESLHPALFALLDLRHVLGLRSCLNTVCRMLNPGGAGASVQGVFHPSYRELQADAATILGWSSLTIIKGGGGEFERLPTKMIAGFGLRGGKPWNGGYEPSLFAHLRLADTVSAATIENVWSGRSVDPLATEIIVGTAAAALDTLGERDTTKRALALWQTRRDRLAA